jgi:NAD(P)H-hydrate epimerase
MLPTVEQAASIDSAAHGTQPARVLVENAGRVAAQMLHRCYPRGRIVGFAGPGNNGRDAIVMLRTLHSWGRDVTLVTIDPERSDPSLLLNHDIATHDFEHLSHELTCDLVVDGILGIGARGAPRDDVAAAIRMVNGMHRPVIALDIPSGIDATSGAVPGDVVNATFTITFGWPKLGMLLFPARAHCGRIVAVEIGFPHNPDAPFAAEAVTSGWAAARAPERSADAHKGSSGRLLVLAGQSGMAGAAAIAARAAVRSGTGLVRIASDAANRSILQLAIPEATFIDRAALTADEVKAASAIVAGPGMGTDTSARAALDFVLQHGAGIPTLLDADALNLLSDDAGTLAGAAGNRRLVITPHPKELARLLHRPIEEIVTERVRVAQETAARFGAVVLLKGQPSLVAVDGAPLLVNTNGTSDDAVAGMGDQLSGMIGGFMAAGGDTRTSAALGLYYGSRAAWLARKGRSLSPDDVSDALADAFADPGPVASALRLPFITFDQPAPQ